MQKLVETKIKFNPIVNNERNKSYLTIQSFKKVCLYEENQRCHKESKVKSYKVIEFYPDLRVPSSSVLDIGI